MKKHWAFLFTTLAITHSSVAAPKAPNQPVVVGVAKKKVAVPSVFSGRLQRRINKGGKDQSVEEALGDFDPDAKVTVAGGKQITVQELVDRLARAESEVQKQRSSMTTVTAKSWSRSSTPLRLATMKSAREQELRLERGPAAPLSPGLSQSTATCTADTCRPKERESKATWEKVIGDEDIAAVSTSFSVLGGSPNGHTTQCGATWNNDVHVVGHKHGLLKFTADAKSLRRPSPTVTAGAALYVLGQSSPVWKKDGRIASDNLDRTFASPKASYKQPVYPGITIELDAQASATLSFRPILQGVATSAEVGCTLGIEPGLTGSFIGTASLTIGIPDLMELASGYIKGQVDLLSTRLPTTLNMNMNMTQSPLAFNLGFKSELHANFLKGRVALGYKLADVCVLGKCLVEDVLGIPTRGEYDLWEDPDGFAYERVLIDKQGTIGFER